MKNLRNRGLWHRCFLLPTSYFVILFVCFLLCLGLAQAGNDNIVNPASSPVRAKLQATPLYANGQVTTSTSAATLKAARPTRRSITFVNTDATITVYIGAATVTAVNGFPLKAGQSISIDTVALIQVIAASGNPVVAYFETYD